MLCFGFGVTPWSPSGASWVPKVNNVSPRRRRPPCIARRVLMPRADSNFYDVLGVPRDATQMAIKKAYRRAALRSHPDVSKEPDAQERFMKIQNAYAILSDETKRRTYDRKLNSGFSGFEDFASSSSRSSGFSDVSDYTRRWREKNPMPEDLNDNLGSIFSDIFSGVSDTVGKSTGGKGQGIFDDFVDFLENQAGGFPSGSRSSSSGSYGSDDGLDDILASSSKEVIETELEDTVFVLAQLSAREDKLRKDCANVDRRAGEWGRRADKSIEELDFYARDEARKRETELRAEADRLRVRRDKVQSMIRSQERRKAKLQEALDKPKTNSGKSESVRRSQQTKEERRREVDDELETLKREMGL